MGTFLIVTAIAVLSQGWAEAGTLRIVGGFDASEDHAGYHASLQNLNGEHVCGGSVISANSIITAAHCVYGAEAEYIKIAVGTTNLNEIQVLYDVESIEIYEQFNFELKTHDIAILKSSKNFNNFEILDIDGNDLQEGDTVTLIGFGASEANGQFSPLLQAIELDVFSQETCIYAMRYTRVVYDMMFCTFNKIGEGTCHGDSGSPLLKDGKLVGLVSWGLPCAIGFPDVHTRISNYTSWIESVIQKNSS